MSWDAMECYSQRYTHTPSCPSAAPLSCSPLLPPLSCPLLPPIRGGAPTQRRSAAGAGQSGMMWGACWHDEGQHPLAPTRPPARPHPMSPSCTPSLGAGTLSEASGPPGGPGTRPAGTRPAGTSPAGPPPPPAKKGAMPMPNPPHSCPQGAHYSQPQAELTNTTSPGPTLHTRHWFMGLASPGLTWP